MQENPVDPSPVYQPRDSGIPASIPVANWNQTTPLYRCVCVANFEVYSHVRYKTLPFLTLREGDLIE